METASLVPPLDESFAFSQEEVDLFSLLSGDINPLHIDPQYGKRSSFGACIVPGVMGVLAALERINITLVGRLGTLKVKFKNPLYVNRNYSCTVDLESEGFCRFSVREGRRVLIQVEIYWLIGDDNGQAVLSQLKYEPAGQQQEYIKEASDICDYDDAVLNAGVAMTGSYASTGLGKFYKSAVKRYGSALIDMLALTSYLTGMKLPGERAIFSGLSLNFERGSQGGYFKYILSTQHFNRDYGLLETQLLVDDTQSTFARGELRSFVRKKITDLPVRNYIAALESSETHLLSGKIAFVTGGGRGLGSALVRSLAVLGAHVYLNYRDSGDQAREVARDLEEHGLSVTLLHGNAGDSTWLASVEAELSAKHQRLDILVCNACEPPSRVDEDASSLLYRANYVKRNLHLIDAPLSAFSTLLAASGGTCVAISSEMVDTSPAGYAHYVDLKRQTEARVRELADAEPSVRTLVVRPSNLLTEMSNTPTRILNAQAPDEVAMRIVNVLSTMDERHCLLTNFSDKAAAVAVSVLMLTGNFTLDAMLDEFDGWLACLPGQHAVRQTGYNRMMQDLVSPDSTLNTAEGTANLLYVRVSDWLYERDACWRDSGLNLSGEEAFVHQIADEFVAALRGFAKRSRATQLLIVCPDPRLDPADPGAPALLEAVYAQFAALAIELPNLMTVFARDYHAIHDIDPGRIDDAQRNRIAHIPYVQSYFRFLAALAVRMLNAKRQQTAKVVVLDCDNTLWKGVCGEENDVRNLVIDEQMRGFQRSMKDLLGRGFILCLCSKNREEDVWHVFDQHPDMVLTRDDIAAAKINWLPKSSNLRALAGELDLGLNSFVFFDDNPLECAEVRANASEVLTICTTQSEVPLSQWTGLLWVFDQLTLTREDSARTQMYREQSQRERFRESAESFRGFIEGLNLHVAIKPMTPEMVDRASQLTLRTNQFNNTTIRRDRSEVIAMMRDDAWHLLVIDVVDRFGDYGTTGFVAYRLEPSCLYVESFLLSCRVLGRTVEDRVMQRLIEIAEETGVGQVHVAFAATRKNTPFRQFLDKIAPQEIVSGDGAEATPSRYLFDRETLRAVLDRQAYLAQQEGSDDAPAEHRPPFIVNERRLTHDVDYGKIAERMNLAFDDIRVSGVEAIAFGAMQADVQPIAGATVAAADQRMAMGVVGREAEREAALMREVKARYARVLGIGPDTIDEYEELERYGLESIDVVNLTVELAKLVPGLAPAFLFEHRTLHSAVRALITDYSTSVPGAAHETAHPAATPTAPAASNTSRRAPADHAEANESDGTREDIAIVGLHGIYPGADDMNAFWQLLQTGECRIVPMPEARRQLIDRAFPGIASTLHGYMDRAGYLDGIERFEAELFGITPKEAELMDPQQRLFLQVVWGLLEDAGYTRHTLDRSTGVFVGVLSNDYAMYANLHALQHPEQYRHTDYYQIANRVSYHFDLTGPSMAIDAACASSGTAFHLACRSIRDGNCESAIVGGVNLILHPSRLIQYSQTGMLSDSGSCTPFGQHADGTLLGEGVGAVLLKPLSRATADGDNIYAIVKASSINSGGKTNGFTVPNPNAQAGLIASVLRASRVPAPGIAYVEAHGTGTALGDPIEVSALSRAFREIGGESVRRIGSVKANVGHGESNAFLASLSKVLLQFRHRQWAPTLTSEQGNPAIDFAAAGFEVQRTLGDWSEREAEGTVAACISNFGAGGSNAHVVLEAWPARAARTPGGATRHLVPLSAHRAELLPLIAHRLREHLLRVDAIACDVGSIAYTLQIGRQHLDHRVVFIVDGRSTLLDALERFAAGAGADPCWLCGSTAERNVLGDFLDRQPDMLELLRKWAREHDHHRIAQLWLHGFTLPWEELHAPTPPVRISLPTYPFRGRPHWLEHTYAPAGLAAKPAPASVASADGDASLFTPAWVREDLPTEARLPARSGARHIVFCGLDTVASVALRAALGATDATVQFLPPVQPEDTAFADHAAALFASLRERLLHGLHEPVLVQVTAAGADSETLDGLAALLKTAGQENPNLSAQCIVLDEAPAAAAWLDVLHDEMRAGRDVAVRYCPQRCVRAWQPLTPAIGPFFDGLVVSAGAPRAYLITGGSGALALPCARWIGAHDRDATIVLLARRDEADLMRSSQGHRIDALRAEGVRVAYRRVDVGDRRALAECVEEICASLGPIHGVIHCAGIVRDAFLMHKSEEDFRAVLTPKVAGALNLDWATRNQPLAFVALFSSISGVLGNSGQADYATANAFMDAFAHRRAAQVRAGARSGRTVSINWPLWRDGGMTLDRELATLLHEQHGLASISNDAGMRALDRALGSDAHQVFVGTGIEDEVARLLAASARRQPAERGGRQPVAPSALTLAPSVLAAADLYPYLKRVLGDATKLDASAIDPHRPLSELGLDSIMLAKLNKVLAGSFRQLPRTLFYEYPTLEALAGYLAEQIRIQDIPADRFVPAHAMSEPAVPALATRSAAEPARLIQPADAPAARPPVHPAMRSAANTPAMRDADPPREQPIAIIGIGGRYPNAPSFEAFWRRLKTESSEIGELPVRRWYGPQADPESDVHPLLRGRKGAFLDDFAQFDPVFFQIAPIDAYSIDPQERLVLMASWAALESSGYTRQRLNARHGRNVAVCVGATKSGFNHFSSGAAVPSGGADARETVTSTSFANMANRVSYFLDLRGPSIAFDTMCTSSLTAIHHACRYLQHGEAELAIAAGVNLHLHPNDYLALERLDMLSDDAQVRCFAMEGNGFIPGEAVGAVVLKRLDAALADGDRIDAVITATGVSHSGRTHGYTAPSLAQQETLILQVIERSGNHVDDIAYVESAANGSSMGDAIEWGALKNVFRTRTQPCAIGSVKPNIGHPEAAAGIAQLSKVVAQLRHRALAPTLVDETSLDSDLLADSGLRLVTRYEPWPAQAGPRKCLITAAGAGGTYAAMVVEQAPDRVDAPADRTANAVVAIALSARTAEALKRVAADLHDHLAAYPEHRLEDIAYTLHEGREAMKVRTGCVVTSRRELMGRLRAMASGEPPTSGERDATLPVASVHAQMRLEVALQAWVDGQNVDWSDAYGSAWTNAHGAPLALPAYPFETRDYWRAPAHAPGVSGRTGSASAPVEPEVAAYSPAASAQRNEAASRPAASPSASPAPVSPEATLREIVAEVKDAIGALLGFDKADAIDDGATFFELGIDSIRMVPFVSGIADRLSVDLDETVLFDYPTISRFCEHVARLRAATVDRATGMDDGAAGRSAPVALATAGRTRVETAAPVTDAVLRQLKELVRTILQYPETEILDNDVTFFELGVDSIRMVGFVRELSARLGLDLEETVLFDHPSIVALAGHLAVLRRADTAALADSPPAWLGQAELQQNLRRYGRTYEEAVPLQTEGEGPLLFCLHPASGDVAMFGRLVTAVGTRCRAVGIKARGFLTKRLLCADACEMAEYYAEVIQAIDPVGPYYVMGASMGGVVAYEVARVLQHAGKHVKSVFMLETPLITDQRDEEIFALDELQNWLTNANFLMIAMLHLDPAFRQRKRAGIVKWEDLVITESDLRIDDGAALDADQVEASLVALIVERGVRQAADILRLRLRSMSDTHRNNLRSMREYRWQPLARPDEVEILMFRTETAKATSDEVYNPNYLYKLQRVHGSMIPLLDTWVEKMPQVRTVIVGGDDHFQLCSQGIGNEEVIGPVLASMHRMHPAAAQHATPADSAPIVAQAPAAAPATSAGPGAFRVAVIGLSARFPGAEDVDAFWRVLSAGESLIRAAPAGRFASADGATDYGCLFERIDEFDNAFFHLSPNEAQLMEPAERLFLQEAWRAVEDAGLVSDRLAGSNWGVFTGSGGDYNLHVQTVLGIAPQVSQSTLPGRVAYHMNLTGPTMAIDAGCASSLMAIRHACDSLRLGQCEIAIAGGAMVYSTRNLIATSHYYRLLSDTEHGAALLSGTTGMLPGEAVGTMVLKPLDAAERDGDRIYAVLDAWGSNHNGRTQGIAAPSAVAQADLLTSTYRSFGIDPDSIGFFEANASGSSLGDKVELQGLRKVFGERSTQRLVLGTVENNVGHSFAASGIAHLLKVILALHRDTLLPTANIDPATAIAGSDGDTFELPTRVRAWPRQAGVARRAGVSSYSATGINVHLVVSEAPPAAFTASSARPEPVLLAISAPTVDALRQRCRDLLDYVSATPAPPWSLAQLSANLLLRRNHFRYRCALRVRDRLHTETLLARFLANEADPDVLTNLDSASGDAESAADQARLSALRRDAAEFNTGQDALPLAHAARWYVHDVAFDARRGFAASDLAPLSLPAYPFERTRHWLLSQAIAAPLAPEEPAAERPERWLLRQVAAITGDQPDALRADTNWSTMGFDSLMSMRLLSAINEQMGVEVQLVDLLDRRTPAELVEYLNGLGAFSPPDGGRERTSDPVAMTLPMVQYPWFGERLAALRAPTSVASFALPPQASAPEPQIDRHLVLSYMLDAGIAVFRDTDKAVLLATRSVDIDAHLRHFPHDAVAASLGALVPGRLWAPLSQEQARNLYLTERMDNTAWNVFHVFRLHAVAVDFERLQHALTLLARQQDLLRTRYVKVGDGYAQCVSELVCVSLDLISTSSRQAFYQFIQSCRSHQMLEEHGGSAIRMWLTETDGAFHLGVVAHHAHADAFTPGLLFSQLMALYESLDGQEAVRADAYAQRDQYWLYALRQHDAGGADAEVHRAYWRNSLSGVDVAMRLPYRDDIASAPSSRKLAVNQIVSVSPELGDRISTLSREHGISYPQLFAAVLAVVLREFFGNDRPVLQVIHNQRDRAALAACLGDFSNVAFVPFEIDARQSVLDTLYAVRRTLLTGLQHARIPATELLQIVGLDGYAGYTAMVGDVVLDSADIDTANVSVAGEHGVSTYMDAVLEQRRIHFLDQPLASMFFQFLRIDGRLYIFHSYSRALFEHEKMQKLPQLIVELTGAMLRDLDAPVASLVAAFGRQFGEIGHAVRALPTRDAPTGEAAGLLERFLGGDLSVGQLRSTLRAASGDVEALAK
ncbi:SDR family NAD(P)-dependent oxidoreductase [Xanthomonas sp. WHRI 10200]|uniref:SDR family NAD(P)-dependent oxidoreductase n=2 Tax=Xanthomonas TaxID=338 RepID=UPI0032E936A9